jgi:hypothetical protein
VDVRGHADPGHEAARAHEKTVLGRYREGCVFPVQGLQFHYALHELAAGRIGYRRWRWELWHGATLHATGWCSSKVGADRALRTYAAKSAHRFVGQRAPGIESMPELSGEPIVPGAIARFSTGPVDYVLVPRGMELPGDPLLAATG